MAVKKKVSLKNLRNLVPGIRNEFRQNAPKIMRAAIKRDMLRGVSPVQGFRWPKYSDSYKAAIRGRPVRVGSIQKEIKKGKRAGQFVNRGIFGIFRTIRGRVVFIPTKAGTQIATNVSELKENVSPVNLKLSGQLHNSLFAEIRGGTIGGGIGIIPMRLVIGFKDKLADIHNRKGAGKRRVIRRLLPTGPNERFNAKISKALKKVLEQSVRRVSGRKTKLPT